MLFSHFISLNLFAFVLASISYILIIQNIIDIIKITHRLTQKAYSKMAVSSSKLSGVRQLMKEQGVDA